MPVRLGDSVCFLQVNLPSRSTEDGVVNHNDPLPSFSVSVASKGFSLSGAAGRNGLAAKSPAEAVMRKEWETDAEALGQIYLLLPWGRLYLGESGVEQELGAFVAILKMVCEEEIERLQTVGVLRGAFGQYAGDGAEISRE